MDEDDYSPMFWKLSMGPGTTAATFKLFLTVLDWLRQGLVLVHQNTGADSYMHQGQSFIEEAKSGHYFYLCHGNENGTGIILLGQFTGPATSVSIEHGKNWAGWAARPFRWLKTSQSNKPYKGQTRQWTPRANTTFIHVPPDQLDEFQSLILKPYFNLRVADLI